ncbi:SCL-interrupting locus protein homolog isoform X2 [Phycodurus eques]|uniref:SCL-interrupting locus protein homolog isoform X2 n=1 Tax=Phycodurus eques TaxID=693459 RepID=UPI002ACDBDFD|nr:SCL-interrupting locus protein homolog isoform X2 [Phycodurus eques]
MSCPVNLQALPADVFHQVLSPDNVRGRPAGRSLTALSFPKSRASLWDARPDGQKLCLQLCSRRMPRLLLHEKALRLAQRHVRHCRASHVHCFFLGSVAVDADEEGVTVTLDRFDPGREQAGASGRVPAAPLPGGVLVPCLISGQTTSDDIVRSEAELRRSFSAVQAHVSGRQPLDLCQLMRVEGRVSCQQRGGAAHLSLGWSSVWPSVRLDVRPVRPVPFVPAPSRKSPSHAPGGRRRGFLTMNQSRHLLLLMESDPTASKLPLVGVWLSGVTRVRNPHVCAWCLRFLFGCALQDRVLSDDGAFLLVILPSELTAPDFFRCRRSGSGPPDCRPLSASRCVTLHQVAPAEGQTLEFELSPEGHVGQVQVFQDARSSFSRGGSHTAAAICERDSGVEDDDGSPRPSPRPHVPAQQAPRVQPAVPELSLLIDGSFSSDRDVRPDADWARCPDAGRCALPPGSAAPAPPPLHSTPDSHPSRRTARCTPAVLSSPPLDPPPSTRAPGPGSPHRPPSPVSPPWLAGSCDTHELLFRQDRQLRLLQVQVQKLLEAQAGPPPSKAKTTSSSVAVATGASLLWGSQTLPTPQPPASSPPSRAPPPPPSALCPEDGGVTGREARGPADSHRSADGQKTPGVAADGRRTPGEAGDGRRTPGESGDGRRTPGESGDGRRTPGEAGDGRRTPGEAGDGRRTPGGAGDGRRTPGGAADGRRTPGGAGDGRRTPGGAGDGRRTPNKVADGQQSPGEAGDGLRTPGEAADDQRTPGQAACGFLTTSDRREAQQPTRSRPNERRGGRGTTTTKRSVTPPSASGADASALCLRYVDGSRVGPAPWPPSLSNMSLATGAYLGRHGLRRGLGGAGPADPLPRNRTTPEPGPETAVDDEHAAGPVGNVLDRTRLRQLPKL